MKPWPHAIEPVPVALLAWKLLHAYRYEAPPHLAVEEMAYTMARECGLGPPVTFEVACDFIRSLDIRVNPTWGPRLATGHSGNNSGFVHSGIWVITTRQRDAETRQTLTLLHELYEVLRKYFHAFECAPFPEGMKESDFVPERMARRFSAAVTMPRGFVATFLDEHGLHIPRLISDTHRSTGCVARRLRELFEEPDFYGRRVPFLAVRCDLQKKLMAKEPPRFKCSEQVRSRQFSLRLHRRRGRYFYFPRAKECWELGELLGMVVSHGAPVFVRRVIGNDLFMDRDLTALAVPEWEDDAVSAITVYATLAGDRDLWDRALPAIDCRTMEQADSLFGAPVEILRRSGLGPEFFDQRTATVQDIEQEVEFYRWPRRKLAYPEDPEGPRPFLWFSNIGLRLNVGRHGQLEWVYDRQADVDWRIDVE